MQLGTNHLGHFVLTNALLDRFAAGTRIVNLSSRGHLISRMRWNDLNYDDESAYDRWQAYGQSKTANVLFTVEAERRWGPDGCTRSPSTRRGHHRAGPPPHRDDVTARLAGHQVVDVSQGAATTVWAATSPELDGAAGSTRGLSRGRSGRRHRDGRLRPYAVDPEQAARLWDWSERQADLHGTG